MMKTVRDILPARRDVLKFGTLSLLGGFVEQGLWPPQVRAAGKSNPRGTARNCIVVEAAGAVSHTDTFDFKENAGTQPDFDVRQIRNGLYLSHRLFPELSSEMDKVSIVRSFWSHEVVHFRGEYYTRAGRPLNPAQVSEIPPVGSVVSYELESQRRETDAFPTFVSCNLGSSSLPSGSSPSAFFWDGYQCPSRRRQRRGAGRSPRSFGRTVPSAERLGKGRRKRARKPRTRPRRVQFVSAGRLSHPRRRPLAGSAGPQRTKTASAMEKTP